MSHPSTGHRHQTGRYEIRLKGHLDSQWAAWFDGLSLTNESDGTTLIHGPVADRPHCTVCSRKSATLACHWSRSPRSTLTNPDAPPIAPS